MAMVKRFDADQEYQDFRFAQLCALTYNLNRNPKKKALSPTDFMPRHQKPKRKTQEQIQREIDTVMFALGGQKTKR